MRVKVAIIDDGVNDKMYEMPHPKVNLISSCGMLQDDNMTQISQNSHGSCCAAILHKYLKCSIDLFSIKVLHNGLGHYLDVITAISWCVKNHINVINMSAGTTNRTDGEFIKKYLVVNRVLENLIIVAAKSNDDLYTYPASVEGVIGVESNICFRNGRFVINKTSENNIDVIASAIHIVRLKDTSSKILCGGNSFAAPLISSCICNIYGEYGNIPKNEIFEILSRKRNV